MFISLVQIPGAKLNPSETPVKRVPSPDWPTISAVDAPGFVSKPPVAVELSPSRADEKRSKRFLSPRKICDRPTHRHQHHQRRAIDHRGRSRRWRPNRRCTGQFFQKVRCCRRRGHRPVPLNFKRSGLETSKRRGSDNDGRLARESFVNIQTSNFRSKRHKHSERQVPEVTETLPTPSSHSPSPPPSLSSSSSSSSSSSPSLSSSSSSSSSSLPAEVLHLHRYRVELTESDEDMKSMQRNRKHRKMESRKNVSNESVPDHLGHPTATRSILPTTETVYPPIPKSRTFKITIGQVIPQRPRSSRRDQQRQEGLKSRRLNISLASTHHSQTSSVSESLVLFEGVWSSKMNELNQLLTDEDFETALMEFIELAYQDQPRHGKRATVLQDSTVEGSTPGTTGTAPSYDDSITSPRPNQTGQEKKICDFRLNYDASKLIDLEGYFRNQLLKTRILSNSMSTLLLSKPFKFRDKLTRDVKRLAKLLEALLKKDSKMVAAALAFDPSQVGPTEPAISPYVVKTRKASRESENSAEEYDDKFLSYNVSSLSKNSYGLAGVKGFEWFWKLRNDYSYLLWRYQNNCQHNANRTVRIPLTLKNESYWGPIQSDCTIRQLGEKSRVQLPANSSVERFGVWTIAHSVPIFGCGHLQNPVFL